MFEKNREIFFRQKQWFPPIFPLLSPSPHSPPLRFSIKRLFGLAVCVCVGRRRLRISTLLPLSPPDAYAVVVWGLLPKLLGAHQRRSPGPITTQQCRSFYFFMFLFLGGGVGGGGSNNTCWEVSLFGHFSEPPRAYEIGTKNQYNPKI